ncbi:adrenodoxin, mitochondrial-like [Choloepus didactylus]|uniref:adrenodoxin, mitochondrial-like n=1 Tax=Choloepus didactylus TaxID=27675 RepID=UPI00189ECB3F|nr:adrenodoxin, mitochondrial-like [Choloepus didactylus]
MDTTGGACLPHVTTAVLGSASHWWWLLARPHMGACGLLGTQRSGGSAGASWVLSMSVLAWSSSEDKITIHFINHDGETVITKGKIGDSLLDAVVENNSDIDGFGACEGTLAWSTCHLIFEEHIFEKLKAITDEENYMLDLAYGITDT